MTLPHPYLLFVKKGSQLELDLLFEDSENLKDLLGPDDDFLKIKRRNTKEVVSQSVYLFFSESESFTSDLANLARSVSVSVST